MRLWPFLSGNEPPQFFLGDFSQAVEVCDLVLQRVIGAVKPKSAVGATVNSQRTTNGVAKLSGADSVVLREHLDAVCQALAFYRHSQPQSKTMDVGSALLGQQRCCEEDPKMPTALAHLQRRLQPVLPVHRPPQNQDLRARARTAEPTPATRSSERSRRFRRPLLVRLLLSADRRQGRLAQWVQPSFAQTLHVSFLGS